MLTEAPLTSMGPCAMCIAQPAQSIATPLVRKYVAYICSLHFTDVLTNIYVFVDTHFWVCIYVIIDVIYLTAVV